MDYLVLWLDCDREGENICFEVISCAMPEALTRPELRTPGRAQRVFRAKFSAVNPSDILQAMASLGAPNESESLSVEARQELDLKVGVAFSRFQTRYFQGKYSDLDARVVSYGPCQTPTLGFCVERHILIQNFVPEPYWVLAPQVCACVCVCTRARAHTPAHTHRHARRPHTHTRAHARAHTRTHARTHARAHTHIPEPHRAPAPQVKVPGYAPVRFDWARGRAFDRRVALAFRALLLDAAALRVVAVTKTEARAARPAPLNTVGFLQAASAGLGMGPAAAMRAAEQLYLDGYISYPRTESTAYPPSMDVAAALHAQARHAVWGDYVAELLRAGPARPRGGVDRGDHPPITPCRFAQAGELGGDAARAYELVVRHFIASLSPDAAYLVTRVEARVGDETFSARGRQLVRPGWKAVMQLRYGGGGAGGSDGSDSDEGEAGWGEEEEGGGRGGEASLPPFGEGDVHPVTDGLLPLEERRTEPPGHLTEAELIALMERHGIGTDASIPTHINNICERNYVQVTPVPPSESSESSESTASAPTRRSRPTSTTSASATTCR